MSQFKPSRRQASILEMVERYGFVATDAMVSEFEVTPQTIRRDLNELSANGLLTRFHGGAGQVKSAENPPYMARLQTGVEAKRKIAETTAALIPNGASLFMSTGTTIETIAEALLKHQNLHVLTNNLHVAQTLRRNESFQILVSCGEVRHHDGGVVGSSSEDYIANFRMDVGILGVSGIDEQGTLLEYSPHEVKTARTILKNSQKKILVADSHKFGRHAMNTVGHMRDVDAIVTDSGLSAHFQRLCESEGVEIHISDSAANQSG